MKMTTEEVLVKAKSLIEDPKFWTRKLMRRRVEDRTCFCAAGAIAEAAQEDGLTRAHAEKVFAHGIMPWLKVCHSDRHAITAFNDAPLTTHADVMSRFNSAISTAGGREAPYVYR